MNLFLLASIVAANSLAPMRGPADGHTVIPDHYIVRLKTTNVYPEDNESMSAVMGHSVWLSSLLSKDTLSKVKHFYEGLGFHGYSGKFTKEIIEEIRRRSDVEYVEKDQLVHVLDWNYLKPTTYLEKKYMKSKRLKAKKHFRAADFKLGKVRIQRNAPWGLCRLSNKYLPTVFKRFTYPISSGKDVDAYVVDTGIRISHDDFEGRAKWGATIPEDDQDIDGNGHGTHVAGTIAGRTYGVAKKAHVYAVKVLRTSGFGSNSDVIKGVEWVIKHHAKKSMGKKSPRSVANMSLGGGKSFALEEMVNKAVKSGVHFAVAAGNDGEDACDYSPAGASEPITVGAVNDLDEIAFFSNHGKCVDIFAPGVDITSAWIGSDYSINTISGTSMASPHVVGVMALYLGEKNMTPTELKSFLLKYGSHGMLKKLPEDETPNILVNIFDLVRRPLFRSPKASKLS